MRNHLAPIVAILAFAILSFSVSATSSCTGGFCANNTYTGSGTLSGMTWAAIHDDMIANYVPPQPHNRNGTQEFTSTTSGNALLWLPWFVYDDDGAESNLHTNYAAGTWTANTFVTDEGRELMLDIAQNLTNAQAQEFFNYMDECSDTTHTVGGIAYGQAWVCSRSGTTTHRNDVNTASDGTSGFAVALFSMSHDPDLSVAIRAEAGRRAVGELEQARQKETLTCQHVSPWNATYNVSKWRLAGSAQASFGCTGLTQVGQDDFGGYHEVHGRAWLAGYAYTHDVNYDTAFRQDIAQYMYEAQYKGGNQSANFTYQFQDKNLYMDCASEPCKTRSGFANGGSDDADLPRALDECHLYDFAVQTYGRYGEALPYEVQVLGQYCTAYKARFSSTGAVTAGGTQLVNATRGCSQIKNDSTCKVVDSANDYRGMGWTLAPIVDSADATSFNTHAALFLTNYDKVNDYYTAAGKGSPVSRTFGVYGQTRFIAEVRTATSYYNFLWTNTSFNYTAWAGTTQNASSGNASTPAPALSGITSSSVTNISFVAGWNSDIGSDSTVYYGTTSGYGTNTTSSSIVMSHTISIVGLTAGTLYHWKAQSCNSGNCTNSSDQTVTTTSNPVVNVSCNSYLYTNVTCTLGNVCFYTANASCTIAPYDFSTRYVYCNRAGVCA